MEPSYCFISWISYSFSNLFPMLDNDFPENCTISFIAYMCHTNLSYSGLLLSTDPIPSKAAVGSDFIGHH